MDRTRFIIYRFSAVIKIDHGVSYQGKRPIQEGGRVVKQDGLLQVSLAASTAGTQRLQSFPYSFGTCNIDLEADVRSWNHKLLEFGRSRRSP